ncbi:flagellar hook capping FlgD N-terminal domain-containing protein [Clostridium septicum]|uniref:Basal-body rod modification protein FlgD n=1 Tax=Clostridium septicum TaxID=1504 RepID=A0A9N7JK95_CLOSE|nr:flagellar hook capping FlgD N-terminal domain-containing protein [Clostridium septicum]AYE33426.1 flagellar biosynthesis protein FlgD [Clostridium septicum]MDU1313964.1 flagellar hook capping FlgD N-terminal domain-containing protein [Clostridium septicum]QAS61600.1 flagellar biosynthesis protein FlgD [Clostridium septicum]UEC21964.1 flagellar biosynthesis protein FlgD [Clostridium septicum]USS00005.1 flagellar biosynthesis protein FlgD [Clostridium septicum]
MSNVINNNYGARATERGTKIMKPGEDMDKNAFLKILSAELSNMDPMGNNDSTQYITQMAQFASMEQMSNLNNTMSSYASHSLVGKGVTMKSVDSDGKPYTGVVKAVTIQNGKTTLSVEVNENGQNSYKDFSLDDVITVLDVPDYSIPPLNNMNGNMSFLLASSFIGKHVELNEQDDNKKNIEGEVLSVIKESGLIKVKVKLQGSEEIKDFDYDKVIKVTK